MASNPSLTMLEVTDEIYIMTPEGKFNPGSDAYTKSEEKIMDWERKIT